MEINKSLEIVITMVKRMSIVKVIDSVNKNIDYSRLLYLICSWYEQIFFAGPINFKSELFFKK